MNPTSGDAYPITGAEAAKLVRQRVGT